MKSEKYWKPELLLLGLSTDWLRSVLFLGHSFHESSSSIRKRTFRGFEHTWNSRFKRFNSRQRLFLELEIFRELCQTNYKVRECTLRYDHPEAGVVNLVDMIKRKIYNGLCIE